MRQGKKLLRTLVELKDPPERVALAFALGVFLGFSPFLGLHTLMGLALAFLFRLNKLAVLIGVYSNTPWIIVPYYGFATWLGTWITGGLEAVHFPAVSFTALMKAEFWGELASNWRLLIPGFIGSQLLCTLLGLASYPLALWLLRRWRRPAESPQTEVPAEGWRAPQLEK